MGSVTYNLCWDESDRDRFRWMLFSRP